MVFVEEKEPLFWKVNRTEKLKYAEALKDWDEDQWICVIHEFCGVVNPSFQFFGPIIENMCEQLKTYQNCFSNGALIDHGRYTDFFLENLEKFLN